MLNRLNNLLTRSATRATTLSNSVYLAPLRTVFTPVEVLVTLGLIVKACTHSVSNKSSVVRPQRNGLDWLGLGMVGVVCVARVVIEHYYPNAAVRCFSRAAAKPETPKDEVAVTTTETPTGKSDAATSLDTYFQTPSTDIMSKIVDLHDDLMFFLVVIVLFVSGMLLRKIIFFNSTNTTTPRVAFAHHTLLEKIGTYIPAGILVLIASPSFSLLYAIDALAEPQITVKVIGHQGYGSYETTDYNTSKDINFDSYMMLETDLPRGGLRLLEVDNRLPLPIRTNIRLIITAADVLHSGAVPALGVKMDACPGRLNQVSLHINRSGAFFGQCSELCGINHSFMPIIVDAVTTEQYQRGVNTQE